MVPRFSQVGKCINCLEMKDNHIEKQISSVIFLFVYLESFYMVRETLTITLLLVGRFCVDIIIVKENEKVLKSGSFFSILVPTLQHDIVDSVW